MNTSWLLWWSHVLSIDTQLTSSATEKQITPVTLSFPREDKKNVYKKNGFQVAMVVLW